MSVKEYNVYPRGYFLHLHETHLWNAMCFSRSTVYIHTCVILKGLNMWRIINIGDQHVSVIEHAAYVTDPCEINPLMPIVIPRVQTWSRLPGTVWRGLIFFTTNGPHYHRMPPLSGDNYGWVWVISAVQTGCALGHVPPQFAHAHIWWKQLRDINYKPKVALSSPDPTSLVGSPGEVPASVHTMGLPGEVLLAGESPGKRDLMWMQGERKPVSSEVNRHASEKE